MAIRQLTGARVKRSEDPRLITGGATYTDDVQLVGTVYGAVARSPIAHGVIKSIDTSKAEKMPGVLAVYTAKTIGDFGAPLPNGWNLTGVRATRHLPLAV